jgi:hypothetical protein
LGTGLILLLLLAAGFTLIVHKTRRRMGLGSTPRTWRALIVGFVLVVLVIYVAQVQP